MKARFGVWGQHASQILHVKALSTSEHWLNHVFSPLVVVWRIIYCSLPGKLNLEFEATGSIVSATNERSAIHRQKLPYRMLSAHMSMYMAYFLYATYPLAMRLYAYYTGHQPSLFPFPGAMMLLIQTTLMACLPLGYMLFPPTVPERDDLMEVDSKGLSRPKKRQEPMPPSAVLLAEIIEVWAIWASL